jgi:hypothetical protein
MPLGPGVVHNLFTFIFVFSIDKTLEKWYNNSVERTNT